MPMYQNTIHLPDGQDALITIQNFPPDDHEFSVTVQVGGWPVTDETFAVVSGLMADAKKIKDALVKLHPAPEPEPEPEPEAE